MERIYKLHKTIKHGEEEITAITVREPTIDEILKLGYPYILIRTPGQWYIIL